MLIVGRMASLRLLLRNNSGIVNKKLKNKKVYRVNDISAFITYNYWKPEKIFFVEETRAH